MAKPSGIGYLLAACILIHHLHLAATSPCNSLFLADPQDVLLSEGDDAILKCTISNFSISTDTLIWEVQPSQYYSVISEVYDRQTKVMTSSLNIYRVGRKGQTQQCVAFIQGSDGITKMCSSATSVLDVQYFPHEDTLACEPKGLVEMKEGQLLKVWCQVSRGEPEVQLKWILNNDPQNLSSATSFVNGTNRVLLQNMRMVRTLHNSSLVCEVTSPAAFPDRKLSCAIGHFIVSHKPWLTLSPSALDIPLDYLKEHRFICNGGAFPAITTYSWSCFPLYVLRGCDLNENSKNTIEVTLSPNNTCSLYEECRIMITCNASNPIGNSIARSLIRIIGNPTSKKQNMTDGPLKSPKKDISLSLVTVSTNIVISGENDAYFVCFVENFTENFTVVWTIGNCTISENNTNIFTGMYDRGEHFLIIKNLTEDVIGKNVYCNYMTGYGESLMSANITLNSIFSRRVPNTLSSLSIPILGNIGSSNLLSKLLSSDAPSTTLLKKSISENSQAIILEPDHGRQYMIIIPIMAALFGIILTACIFGVISLFLYRRLGQMRSTFRSQEHNTVKEPIRLQEMIRENQGTLSLIEMAGMEPTYEEPNQINTQQQNQTETYTDSMIYYTYETSITKDCGKTTKYLSSVSSSLSSSESFNDSSSSDGFATSTQCSSNLASSTEDCIYTNESAIKMHTMKRPHLNIPKRHELVLANFEEPPSLPNKTGDNKIQSTA